jgi:16S rRNA (uracil1498-N3)-methyltransferase
MNRFYVDKSRIDAKRVKITGEDVRHITRVLRLGIGDKLVICDGCNTDYDGIIQRITKEEVSVALGQGRCSGTEPPVELVLFQSITKGTKMDYIIQKGTELGIRRLVPVVTSRTVVRLEGQHDEAKKVARWQRIALEAAKQSRRGIIPAVDMPVGFKQAIGMMRDFDLALMPYEGEGSNTVTSTCSSRQGIDRIALLIGPEGGFDENEVDRARNAGIDTVKLGPRILRTETAGMVLIVMLMYLFGDLGGL